MLLLMLQQGVLLFFFLLSGYCNAVRVKEISLSLATIRHRIRGDTRNAFLCALSVGKVRTLDPSLRCSVKGRTPFLEETLHNRGETSCAPTKPSRHLASCTPVLKPLIKEDTSSITID